MKLSTLRTYLPHLLTCSDGITMLVVLLVLMTVSVISLFGAYKTQTEIRIAHNSLLSKKALAAAEAGVNHASALIAADTSDGLDDELSNGGTGGGLASLGSVVTIDGESYVVRQFGSSANDIYAVRVVDNFDETTGANDPSTDTDGKIKIIARSSIGGAERLLEVMVQSSAGPDCAIITEDALVISGDPAVTGANGCAHTNEDLDVSGNPSLSQGATSSQTMTISGVPTMAGTTLSASGDKVAYANSHSNQTSLSLPQVNPLDFGGPGGVNLALAVAARSTAGTPQGFRLDNNCRVYWDDPTDATDDWSCTPNQNPPNCTGGTELFDASGGGSYNGWSCTSGDIASNPAARWSVSGNVAGDGAYFVEGWVSVSGNPGEDTAMSPPWQVTIIALNSIQISGNPTMAPYTTTGDLRNLLLVSGNDVEINGNALADGYSGAILAHQQIKVNGNPQVQGFIFAEDGRSTWVGDIASSATAEKNLLSSPNLISGNMTLTYNGLSTIFFSTRVELLSWNEVRN